MLDKNSTLLNNLNFLGRTEISLHQIFLADDQLNELFISIKDAKTITKIDLVSCGLKFVEVNNLLCHLRKHRITELNLSGNLLATSSDLSKTIKLVKEKLPYLAKLNLSSIKFDGVAISALKEMLESSEITELTLNECGITDAMFNSLATTFSKLHHLSMRGNDITQAPFSESRPFPKNLQYANFSYSRLSTAEQIKVLTAAKNSLSLKMVKLYNTSGNFIEASVTVATQNSHIYSCDMVKEV